MQGEGAFAGSRTKRPRPTEMRQEGTVSEDERSLKAAPLVLRVARASGPRFRSNRGRDASVTRKTVRSFNSLNTLLLPPPLRRVLGRLGRQAFLFVMLRDHLLAPGDAPVGFGHQLGQGLEGHL